MRIDNKQRAKESLAALKEVTKEFAEVAGISLAEAEKRVLDSFKAAMKKKT